MFLTIGILLPDSKDTAMAQAGRKPVKEDSDTAKVVDRSDSWSSWRQVGMPPASSSL